MRAAINSAAIPHDGPCEGLDIRDGIALRLPSEPQGTAVQRRTIHAREPGAVTRRQFSVEHLTIAEQITIDALELALDVFGAGDRLDLVDRRDVTLGREPRGVEAVQALERIVPVIQYRGDMRGRSSGLAAGYATVVDRDDCLTGACQEIRGRDAGHPQADDAHVGVGIVAEWRIPRDARSVAIPPDWDRGAHAVI